MIKTTARAVAKHPSIVITIGLIMLAGALFNRFIPVMALIIGVINMTGGDFFDSVLALMQMLIDPQNVLAILIATAVLAVFASVVIGLVLPGYLLTVNDGLEKGAGKRGLYRKGIRNYFLKFFLIAIRTVFLSVVMLVFMLVSSVPAIVITKLVSTRNDLILAAIFIDIVTIGVFFAILSFFSAYIYMWFITSLTESERPFRDGKAIADSNFWNIALSLLAFDVIFAVCIFLIYIVGSHVLRYILGWTFTTAFFTVLAVYLVQFFRDSSALVIDNGSTDENWEDCPHS